jgi:hypothetical protein
MPEGESLPQSLVQKRLVDKLLVALPDMAWPCWDGCGWPPLVTYQFIAARELRNALNRRVLVVAGIEEPHFSAKRVLCRLVDAVTEFLLGRRDRGPAPPRTRAEQEAAHILETLRF